jgi:hypothetical protein
MKKMRECRICLESFDCKSCEKCLQETCYKCTILNDGRCCYCGYIFDDVDREIQMQIFALHDIIKVKKCNISYVDDIIKQCPICNTQIERNKDDCKQMFCTICKTVWQWDTLEVVTNVLDIHNPLFFNRNVTSISESNNRGVAKCLKALNEENAKYAADTFIYRLLFTTEQITFEEFKNMIRDRFNTFIKHIKLKQVLETDCDNVKIKQINDKWNLTNDMINLPYV